MALQEMATACQKALRVYALTFPAPKKTPQTHIRDIPSLCAPAETANNRRTHSSKCFKADRVASLLIFSQFVDRPNPTVLNVFSKQDYTACEIKRR